jgi:hypothetical protein
LDVTVERITEDLQEYFGFKSSGARSPGIPPPSWARKALDALASSKLARRIDESKYQVEYKRSHVDTLRKFGLMCFKLAQKSRRGPADRTLTLPGLFGEH